jgi:hypothetical protein
MQIDADKWSKRMTEQITKADLMDRIADAFEALEMVLARLDDATMARPDATSGWAIKDHLFHLAAWEQGVARLLAGRSRFEGMGVTREEWAARTMDEVNDLVYQRNRDSTPGQALTAFRAAHQEMLDALAPLGNADLQRPYTDFDPQATQWAERPIVGWIIGDTFEHYEEHLGYIQSLLAS